MKSPKLVIFSCTLVTILLGCGTKTDQGSPANTAIGNIPKENAPKTLEYKTIEWSDLLPAAELKALMNPPDYITDQGARFKYYRVINRLKAGKPDPKDPYQLALLSKNTRPEYNGRRVRLPSFIVPVEIDDEEIITSAFLMPFLGSWARDVPPPPPNQTIYIEFEPGLRIAFMYDAFWIKGTLATTFVENEDGVAAYSMVFAGIEPYEEPLGEAMDAKNAMADATEAN